MMDGQRQIGIVGLGVMGAGIAQLLIEGGHFVLGHDPMSKSVNDLQKLNGQGSGGFQVAQDISMLSDCWLIIEALPEDLALKSKVLQPLTQFKGLLASNTSSLSIRQLASVFPSQAKVFGLHFFNPATKMKLVELIDPPDGATESHIRELLEPLGKVIVRCSDTPGFIVNRVARPFYLEAMTIVSEGVASLAVVDRIMKSVGGFKMGPFELMDLIGLDTNLAVSNSVYQSFYQEPRFRPHQLQAQLVARGNLGRKSGQGFYSYVGERSVANLPFLQVPLLADRILPNHSLDVVRDWRSVGVRLPEILPGDLELELPEWVKVIPPEVGATGVDVIFDLSQEVSWDPQLTLEFIEENPKSLILIDTGGVQVQTLEDTFQADLPNVINIHGDFKRGFEVGVGPHSHRQQIEQLSHFFDSHRIPYFLVADAPGLVCRRIVSCLINEAFWLLQTGTATAKDIDMAMRLGTGYPINLIDSVSVSTIQTLSELHLWVNSARYPISPLLRSTVDQEF